MSSVFELMDTLIKSFQYMVYLFQCFYWRTQVLWAGWSEHCPWVYSTFEMSISSPYDEQMQRCLEPSCMQLIFQFIFWWLPLNEDPLTTSISSFAPDSKPWELWKIKLLPMYVIPCSMTCMPLWKFNVYHQKSILYDLTSHLHWWHSM